MRRLQNIALLFFFFSINFEVWDPFNTNGYFSISKLTGYIYLLTMVPFLVQNVTNDCIKKILNPILLFFSLLTIVNIININTSSFSFLDFSIFQNIVLLWLLLNHDQDEPLVLEKGMLGFALGSVTLALLFYAGIGIEYIGDRVTIFNDNQNNVGLRMSISIIVILTIVFQNRLEIGKLRYILLIPIPIMLTLLAESGSRVAFVSFVLAFIIGGVLYKTRKVGVKAFVLIVASIAFMAIWQFLLQNEVLSTRLLQTIQEGDLSERDIIWRRLVPLIKDNPFFGVGNTGYIYFTQSTFGEVTSPHNVFIELLCLTGITGLILYIVFLFRIFSKAYHIYSAKGMLLPMLLMLPVLGLLMSGQILVVKIGWVIFAYIASSENSSQN